MIEEHGNDHFNGQILMTKWVVLRSGISPFSVVKKAVDNKDIWEESMTPKQKPRSNCWYMASAL